MTGFGLGSVIFNYIIVAIANPNNEAVDPITNKFPKSVADNLPFALKILAATYFGAGFMACVFIRPPKVRDSLFNESLVSQKTTE